LRGLMPLKTMLHQIQFPAMPFLATNPVTASGVSAANVVATIEPRLLDGLLKCPNPVLAPSQREEP
jgi:hypothetical protein